MGRTSPCAAPTRTSPPPPTSAAPLPCADRQHLRHAHRAEQSLWPGLRRQRQPLRRQLRQQHDEQGNARRAPINTFVTLTGLTNPDGLAFDASGNLYVANYSSSTVSKVRLGGVVNAFVTSGLHSPAGLAFDASGNLYVANDGNNTVSKVTPVGHAGHHLRHLRAERSRWPGLRRQRQPLRRQLRQQHGEQGTPSGTLLNTSVTRAERPHGLAFDASGNLYVANIGSSTVSKVTPVGRSVTATYLRD